MKQGLYEQIINNITSQQLSALDPEVYEIGREPLDAEEARKMLSNYLAMVTRRALKVVREQSSDEEAVLAQIRICNEIIDTLKHTSPDFDFTSPKMKSNLTHEWGAYTKELRKKKTYHKQ